VTAALDTDAGALRLLLERRVRVIFHSDALTAAEVDGRLTYAVRWTSDAGWRCGCGDVACVHIAAVRFVADHASEVTS